MTELGRPAPELALPNVLTAKPVALEDFRDRKALLVMFICRHCPYVMHVKPELIRLGNDFRNKDLGIVAISANDANAYPADAPDKLAEMARDLPFPLLYDEPQGVAKAYRAVCTPDFFLFNQDRRLVYRGQLDDSRPGNNRPLTGRDLRAAIDAVLLDKPVDPNQRASVGCSIKWKPGSELGF
jgi:peroxiredoxin